MPTDVDVGHTWRSLFPGRPDQAGAVRRWVAAHLAEHTTDLGLPPDPGRDCDAQLVASELFTAAAHVRPHAVQMTLSTSGTRARVYATAPEPLPGRSRGRVAWRIVMGLAQRAGVEPDERTVWAELDLQEPPR